MLLGKNCIQDINSHYIVGGNVRELWEYLLFTLVHAPIATVNAKSNVEINKLCAIYLLK